MRLLFSSLVVVFLLGTASSSYVEATLIRRHHPRLVMPLIHSDAVVNRSNTLQYNSSLFGLAYDFFSPLKPDNHIYNKKYFYVQVGIGSQGVSQDLIIDTGSSLNWLSCYESMYAQDGAYNPQQSSTYNTLRCYNKTFCNVGYGIGLVQTECGKRGDCIYNQKYVNKVNIGSLGSDTFWWGENEDDYVPSWPIVFGCSRTNVLVDGKGVRGVLGLGNDVLSFLRQSKLTKFGHCISNITDPNNFDHQLLIGNDLEILSSSEILQETPLTIRVGKYTVLLKSITFRGSWVGNDPTIYTTGMILDTASTLSYLPKKVVKVLEDLADQEVQGLGGSRNDSVVYAGQSQTYKRLSYNGRLYQVLDLFPMVKFVFDGDASMYLERGNLFQQYDIDLFCLAIVPSEADYGKIIMGNLMMQNYYYVYDISEWKLSFGQQCCAMETRCFPMLTPE